MAKQVSSKRGQGSTGNKALRLDKRMFEGERLRDFQDHEARLNHQRTRVAKGRAKASRHLALKNRSNRQRSVHSDVHGRDRYDDHLAQASACNARYPAVAQPEVAYNDVYRGGYAPSPPLSPVEEIYTYCGYSREKGEDFEFDDDRPLSRKRIIWLKFAQVGDNHILSPPPVPLPKKMSMNLPSV